ncbi:hypothetical protein BsWGS_00955 [Bradybaena similaris]
MLPRKLMLTLTLVLTLATSTLTQSPAPGGKARILSEINTMFKLEQVKTNILRALNMTSPPSPGMTSSHASRTPSKTARLLQPVDRQLNVSILLSDSTGSNSQDTISFSFDSRLREQGPYIDTVLLILFLNVSDDISGGRPPTAGRARGPQSANASNDVTSSRFARYNGDPHAWTNDSTTAMSTHKMSSRTHPRPGNTSTSVADNSIRRQGQAEKDGGDTSQRRRAVKKQPRVKVTLKVVDQRTGRKHKIAQKQVTVKGSSTIDIPVPKDVVVAAAASQNHTLVLQVSCRRCKGQVEIEKVYKTFTRRNKKPERRLNPNRPYLFLKMTGNMPGRDLGSSSRGRELGGSSRGRDLDSPNEIVRKRSRRKTTQTCPRMEGSGEVGKVSPGDGICTSEMVFFSFHDLGLSFIIYPRGVSTAVCFGSCPTPDGMATWGRLQRDSPNNATLTRERHSRRKGRQSAAQQVVLSKEVGNVDSAPRARTPGTTSCVPARPRPLSVVYVGRDRRLVALRLDDAVHQSCVCSSNV